MPEHYKPGQRHPQFGQNYRLSESRYAWVQVESGKFLILVGEDLGSGTDVTLFHPKPGKQPNVSINLTNLTLPELDALKDIFDSAFEWARPVVERRDKEAQDAWDSGDDSHSRNYRPIPQLVYRKRPGGEHGQGVQQRPEGVSEGSGRGGSDHVGGVRGAGDELAEPDSQHGGSEDDGSQVDHS